MTSHLFHGQNSWSGCLPLSLPSFPLCQGFPDHPGVFLAPLRVTGARGNSSTSVLFPGELYTAVIFSPHPQVLEVVGAWGGPSHARNSVPRYLEERLLLPKQGEVFPSPSSLACCAEPASHTGAAASGLGDHLSPRQKPHCQEAQVCKGSAGLRADGEMLVAEAWAARSW